MNMYYKLVDRVPVPCRLEEIVDEFSKDRHVRLTKIGCLTVSTVFLVLNHALGDGPPIVFETMIFGDGSDDYQTRCATWDQAEAMHSKAVAYATDLVRNADALISPPR